MNYGTKVSSIIFLEKDEKSEELLFAFTLFAILSDIDDCQDDSRLPLLFYLFASVECIISILCIALASYFE